MGDIVLTNTYEVLNVQPDAAIPLDTIELFDGDLSYNPGSGATTIGSTGQYLVSYRVTLSGAARVALMRNGAPMVTGTVTTSSGNRTASFSFPAQLDAGDTIALANSGSSPFTVLANGAVLVLVRLR